jgi:hypothetical protein
MTTKTTILSPSLVSSGKAFAKLGEQLAKGELAVGVASHNLIAGLLAFLAEQKVAEFKGAAYGYIGAQFKQAYMKGKGRGEEYLMALALSPDKRKEGHKTAIISADTSLARHKKAALAIAAMKPAARPALFSIKHGDKERAAKAKGSSNRVTKGGAMPPAIAALNASAPLGAVGMAIVEGDDLGRKIKRHTSEALAKVQAFGKCAGFGALGANDRELFAALLNEIGTLNELINGSKGK